MNKIRGNIFALMIIFDIVQHLAKKKKGAQFQLLNIVWKRRNFTYLRIYLASQRFSTNIARNTNFFFPSHRVKTELSIDISFYSIL